jgi:hypothetical protein
MKLQQTMSRAVRTTVEFGPDVLAFEYLGEYLSKRYVMFLHRITHSIDNANSTLNATAVDLRVNLTTCITRQMNMATPAMHFAV